MCKHSSEKALLQHVCKSRWNTKEQVWAGLLSYTSVIVSIHIK